MWVPAVHAGVDLLKSPLEDLSASDTFDIQSLFRFNVFKPKTNKSYEYRFNVIKNPHVIIENYGILLE